MDMTDPLEPKPVLFKDLTQDYSTDLYGENFVYEVIINDLSDPEAPVPISLFRLKKDSFEAEIIDKAVMRLLEDKFEVEVIGKAVMRLEGDKFEVELDDETKRLIVTKDLIELGAASAQDKAVLDSKLQTELDAISEAIADLVTDFNDHTHPIPTFVAPLIPISDAPTVPNDDPTNADIILTTLSTSLVSYDKGDTNSGLVTIES